MIAYIFWHDGIYLGTIVQEGHTTFPIYPHFSYVFDPCTIALKGSRFKKGVCGDGFYTSGASIWRVLQWHSLLLEGSGLPSLDVVPSFPFNCFLSLEVFTSMQLQMKCSGLLQW